jgi:hypothetical protein
MPNITVTVSEASYRQARVWAAIHNTSVSAIVQYCIERLPTLPVSIEGTVATARHRKQRTPSSAPANTPSVEPTSSDPGKNPGCETVKPAPIE